MHPNHARPDATDAPCIKRPRSVWTQCRCATCAPEQARLNKMRRNGRYRRPLSDQAWEVIDGLRARGWTSLAVASATGIPHPTMQNAFTSADRGVRQEFGPGMTLRILRHGDPTAGSVGAYAARRRLQGLARQRWSLTSLAAETGLPFSTLAAIRGRTDGVRIQVAHDRAIREATARIGMTVGDSPAAARHAEQKGWLSLLAWDDIDDPKERPKLGRQAERHQRRKTDVDEAVVLRVLAGEILPMTTAERFEVMARWLARGGTERALCERLNWKEGRYSQPYVIGNVSEPARRTPSGDGEAAA